MEIALQKFQDLFSSIGHAVRCKYFSKKLNVIFTAHIISLALYYNFFIMSVAKYYLFLNLLSTRE
jgi:hypothetical protein